MQSAGWSFILSHAGDTIAVSFFQGRIGMWWREVRSFLGAWPSDCPTSGWEAAASTFRTVPSEQYMNRGHVAHPAPSRPSSGNAQPAPGPKLVVARSVSRRPWTDPSFMRSLAEST